MAAILLSNTGAEVNLLLRKGAAFGRTFTYKINGIVTNITGYTFAGQIRTAAGTLAATFTCTITNAAQGQFSIALTAAAINGLLVDTVYSWDLEVTHNSMTFELMRGIVTVVTESTQ
jgi:hypothetical protein